MVEEKVLVARKDVVAAVDACLMKNTEVIRVIWGFLLLLLQLKWQKTPKDLREEDNGIILIFQGQKLMPVMKKSEMLLIEVLAKWENEEPIKFPRKELVILFIPVKSM